MHVGHCERAEVATRLAFAFCTLRMQPVRHRMSRCNGVTQILQRPQHISTNKHEKEENIQKKKKKPRVFAFAFALGFLQPHWVRSKDLDLAEAKERCGT
jgi:hypothetical protein